MRNKRLDVTYEFDSTAKDVQGRIAHAFDLIFSKIPHEGCDCDWTSVEEILPGRAKEILRRCQRHTIKEYKNERNI